MKLDSSGAEEIFKEWRDALEFESGLQIKNTPVVLIKRDIFYLLYEGLSKIVGAPAITIMSFAGEGYGKELYRDVAAECGEDRDMAIKALCNIISASGIGDIEIEVSDTDIEITVPEGLPIGKKAKGRAADSYFVGMFSEFFSELFNKRFEGNEEECLAKGDSICRIVLKEKGV